VRDDGSVADRLRDLLDLVVASVDDPGADGHGLAGRAHFSRDHLDRIVAGATGESPAALRRRLLLERAAWQLGAEVASATEVAAAAGYGSLAAFSRAFARAFGLPPSGFAAAGRPAELPAPNGIHFHPPAGLLVPGSATAAGARRDPLDHLLAHHLRHARELLAACLTVPAAELDRPLRAGFTATWFEGEEPSAAAIAEGLVFALEVWVAAIAGRAAPEPPRAGGGDGARARVDRFERAARDLARLARRIQARGAWEDAFVDALCEPPESFTYGGVLAHVVEYGAVRRHALRGLLRELGAVMPSSGDPLER